MKQVMIDCTPSLFPNNGIGRVTGALVKNMLRQSQIPELCLYSRSLTKKLTGFGSCPKLQLHIPKLFEGLIKKFNIIEKLSPKTDLYHATDHYLPIQNYDKTIVTVHDLIFLKCPEKHNLKLHLQMGKRTPKLLKKCRHLITCSEFTKKDLINYLNIEPEKITVIPWGLDHSLFRPADDLAQTKINLCEQLGISSNYFLGVSCSTGRKNTLMLLNCYEELLKDHPKNDLVLVWDAPEEIRARYNHPRIHFTGKVKDSTLSDLYNCATSTIYPSLYEGFGLPVLESLSCGTPVICSDVTSLPEVGGEHCKYINPLDPSALTQEMMNFENNVYDLKKMSDDGIKHAQKYTWEKCANETLNVYRSLVK